MTKLRDNFGINWTTILVGWNGLSAFSPWPDRSDGFPPFLSTDELLTYANERLLRSSDPTEQDLLVNLLSLDLCNETRPTITNVLTRLSDLARSDPAFEIRKWRVLLLEELLSKLPKDALYGLTALTEFWQSFGFPLDSPHEIQGRGNDITPAEYYSDQNLQRLVARHRAWVEDEKAAITKLDAR